MADHLGIDESILRDGGTGIGVLNEFSGVFSDALKEKGYDGVITKYGEFVVFEPTQIKEIKFETAKEFMTNYRSEILAAISAKYQFKIFNMKEVATLYFDYILNSQYNRYFTLTINIADVSKLIENSVQTFALKNEFNFATDAVAVENFEIKRKQAAFNSHSYFTKN